MAKILVVDDEQEVRATIEVVLTDAGHDVILAGDGEGALESIRQNLPDVIICDIEMPKLKGFDVLVELRKDSAISSIPIMFLTGKTDIETLVQSMELNVNDFLTKPFNVQELIVSINYQLKKSM